MTSAFAFTKFSKSHDFDSGFYFHSKAVSHFCTNTFEIHQVSARSKVGLEGGIDFYPTAEPDEFEMLSTFL